MQKSKLKYNDFRRSLAQLQLVNFPLFHCKEGIFFIDPTKINRPYIAEKLLLVSTDELSSFSLEWFCDLMGVKHSNTWQLTPQLMARLARAQKELEWWADRNDLKETLPAKHLKKDEFDTATLTSFGRSLDRCKEWLSKEQSEPEVLKGNPLLILDSEWKPYGNRLSVLGLESKAQILLKLAYWLSGPTRFSEIFDSIAGQLSQVPESTTAFLGQQSAILHCKLAYLFTGGNSDFDEDLELYQLRQWVLQESRRRSIREEYVENHVKKAIPLIEEIYFYDWHDLVAGNPDAYASLLEALQDYLRNRAEMPFETYLRLLVGLVSLPQIVLPSASLYALFLSLVPVRTNFSGSSVGGVLSAIDSIRDPAKLGKYLQSRADAGFNGSRPWYEIREDAEILNWGFSIQDLDKARALDCADKLEYLSSRPYLGPVYLRVVELSDHVRELSDASVKDFRDSDEVERFGKLSESSTELLSRLLDSIEEVIDRIADVDPKTTQSAFEELIEIVILGTGVGVNALRKWLAIPCDTSLPTELDAIHLSPASEKQLLEYLHHCALLGQPSLPRRIQGIVNMREKFLREKRYLEALVLEASSSSIENVEKRLKNVSRKLDNLPASSEKESTKIIRSALPAVRILSLKKETQRFFLKRFLSIWPTLRNTSGVVDIPYLSRLVAFATTSKRNRELLELVISNYTSHGLSYRQHLRENEAWLCDAERAGIDRVVWLEPLVETFETTQGTITIEEAATPFEIFAMGVYFDTCLSIPFGENCEAVIVNAADINKKVLYAKDSKGKILGRKLIGITKDWRLAGYRSYGGEEIRRIMNVYCQKLATLLRVSFTNTGRVQLLHRGFWYDDGLEEFVAGVADQNWPAKLGDFLSGNSIAVQKALDELCIECHGLDTLVTDNLRLAVEVAVYVANQVRDDHFLEEVTLRVTGQPRVDALYYLGLLRGDTMVETLRGYAENRQSDFHEASAACLAAMRTADSIRALARVWLSNDYYSFWYWTSYVDTMDLDGTLEGDLLTELLKVKTDTNRWVDELWRKVLPLISDDTLAKYIYRLLVRTSDALTREGSTFHYFGLEAIGQIILTVCPEENVKPRELLTVIRNPYEYHTFLAQFLANHPSRLSDMCFSQLLKSEKLADVEWAAVYLACRHGHRYSQRIRALVNQYPSSFPLRLAEQILHRLGRAKSPQIDQSIDRGSAGNIELCLWSRAIAENDPATSCEQLRNLRREKESPGETSIPRLTEYTREQGEFLHFWLCRALIYGMKRTGFDAKAEQTARNLRSHIGVAHNCYDYTLYYFLYKRALTISEETERLRILSYCLTVRHLDSSRLAEHNSRLVYKMLANQSHQESLARYLQKNKFSFTHDYAVANHEAFLLARSLFGDSLKSTANFGKDQSSKGESGLIEQLESFWVELWGASPDIDLRFVALCNSTDRLSLFREKFKNTSPLRETLARNRIAELGGQSKQ